jgi:four helix bundle protein
MLRSFRELELWQKAHTLVLDVYRVTARFPHSGRFGIVSQLRRASASIPANIAEGFGRNGTKEFLQSLAIANGSLEEVRYFLILSSDLHYLAPDDSLRIDGICNSIGQMLGALSRSLRNRAAVSSRSAGRGTRATSAPLQAGGKG